MMQDTQPQAQPAGFWDFLDFLFALPQLVMLMVMIMIMSMMMEFM